MSKTFETAGSVLGLHVDTKGEVWSARPDQPPRRTRLTAAEFANNAPLKGDTVRLLGSQENCCLLCSLHARHLIEPFRLEVASPQLVPDNLSPLRQSQAVANSPGLAPSLGGWHPVTELDMATYRMTLLLQSEGYNQTALLRLLYRHPVWPLIQFIPTLDCQSLAHWLAGVRDPRWYISEDRPESTSRLEQFLGLRPGVQRRVLRGDLTGRAANRCHLTRMCWMPNDVHRVSKLDANDPRNFLFRILGGQFGRNAAVGLVRASQTFTRFVRAIWLDAMSVGTHHEGELFVPEQFFKTAAEQEAFQEFRESLLVQ